MDYNRTVVNSSNHVISHAQVVNCQNGFKLASTDLSVRNTLLYNTLTNFSGTSSTARCEHITADGGAWFNSGPSLTLYLTNSLLTAMTNATNSIATMNSVAVLASANGVYQTVGAGAHYLPANSTNRNQGTTNINSTLLRELQAKTTEAPLVWTNLVSTNLTLSPQVFRDRDTPDRGFHYDPIDHAVGYLTVSNAALSITVTNTALQLTDATAIANFGPACGGIWLCGHSSLCAEGTPLSPIRLTRFATVQENSLEWGGPLAGTSIMHISTATMTGPASLRFARLDQFPINGVFYSFYGGGGLWSFSSLLVRDC